MDNVTRLLMQGAAGGKKDSTYVDDVFSTFLYAGNETARSINNGIDVAGEGGMVWLKRRTGAGENHETFDTERGAGNFVRPDATDANLLDANRLSAFNSNGFSLGTAVQVNNDENYASWTFRKSPGFFDVVTYTGNNTAGRQISHDLGSIPGMIFIKKLNSANNWIVYHRSTDSTAPEDYILLLNTDNEKIDADQFNDTKPTASHFTLGGANDVNGGSDTYVAYLFAGGESTAATARSVDFDGSGDELQVPDSTDFDFGNGDFTIEYWLKTPYTTSAANVGKSNNAGTDRAWLVYFDQQKVKFYWTEGASSNTSWSGPISTISTFMDDQWHHVAVTRTGGYFRLFVDGVEEANHNIGTTSIPTSSSTVDIGGLEGTNLFTGKVSNVRIVKGTAVYTSSFRPPTEPLTNITNTKLLCCNNSSTTGATVAPGAITANGNPTAIIDSPFDDPEGFQFGEEGDQNIIKCGSYIGNGQANESGPFTNLGWEPQFLLIKNTSSAASWAMFDTMRGIRTGGKTQTLSANLSNAEGDYTNFATVASTGFYAGYNDVYTNSNTDNYIYMAIRSVDGLVSKPPEAGTDVFAMDTGNSSSTIPALDSDFPVGMAFYKNPAGSGDWYLSGRLMSNQRLQPDSIVSQSTDNDFVFDSNVGWYKGSYMNTTYQSWMFKRGQSFDVMTYMGNNAKRSIPHSLGRPPEMIWIKKRDANSEWAIGHKGLNGGTNPWNYRLLLSSAATGAANDYWAAPGAPNNTGTAPTSTVFSLGPTWSESNSNLNSFIAMLFASVDGISKVGYYTGTGAAGNTQTTGFTPRFIIVKCESDTADWAIFDTLRGLGSSGNDKRLYLNSTAAQVDGYDYLTTSSTGFTPAFVGSSVVNSSGQNYIYYAHA